MANSSDDPTAAELYAAKAAAERETNQADKEGSERRRANDERRNAAWQALAAAAESWTQDPSHETRAALAAALGDLARELDAQGLRDNLTLAHERARAAFRLDPSGDSSNRADIGEVALVCELLATALEPSRAGELAGILATLPAAAMRPAMLESAAFEILQAPQIGFPPPGPAVIPAAKASGPELAAGPAVKPQDLTGDAGQDGGGQKVTLLQAAALVNRSARTLERWAGKRGFPRPAVLGGGGKPHEYAWSELRPFLEKESGRKLPERLADIRVGSGRADRH